MSDEGWSARTRAIVAGRPTGDGEPMNVPIVPASVIGDGYARELATPTWQAFEQAVGELEGGEVTAFASGIAAVAAALDLLDAGAEVAVPTSSYTGTRGLLAHSADRGRLRVRRIEPSDTPAWVAAAGEVDLLWIESPTNPTLESMDVGAIAEAAAKRSPRPYVVVDNTFATPLGAQPLREGADLVVHSATKLIGGHSDLLLGLTATADTDLAAELRRARTLAGATPGALEAWLALRGLRTLPLRLAEASRTAALLAGRLGEHPTVRTVRYPGAGAMLAFDVADAETAEKFCRSLTLIATATSLGGVESTLERRAGQPGEEHVPAGLIRFSVGLEDPEDLWRDLDQALSAVV